jgi:hypothetical protein
MAYLDRTGWTVTASSEYPTWGPASWVLDGDRGSSWNSYPPTPYPHWLKLDRHNNLPFDTIEWDGPSYMPTSVEVYLSDDDVAYTLAATLTWPRGTDAYKQIIMLPRTTARYIRFDGLAGTDRMGCAELNLILEDIPRYGWVASATSNYDAATVPQNALDGYDEENFSFWISGGADGAPTPFPHRLAVDMQTPRLIDYVKYVPGNTRLYVPILYGQPVPVLARLYISNLETPNINDLGDWTLVGEQYWPEDQRTHFIYASSPVTARHFMIEGVHDVRYGGDTTYHRMCCAEVYAGLLKAGDSIKVYHRAHPKQFHIFPDNVLEGEARSDAGFVDALEFVPSLASPANLQLGRAVCQSRLWHTSPLRNFYPEAMFWDYDLPQKFPDISNPQWDDLPIETVSRMVEGSETDSTTLSAATSLTNSVDQATVCGSIFGSWPPEEHGIFQAALISGPWSPGIFLTFWDVDDASHLEDLDGFVRTTPYGHLHLWNSVSQTSPDHDIDVARMNTTDIFYLIVWPDVYQPPVITEISGSPPGELHFTGYPSAVSNRGSCILFPKPSIVPDLAAVSPTFSSTSPPLATVAMPNERKGT